eukprot:UN25673
MMDKDKTAKDYYFDSYSHFGIHEEMLKDFVRTNTYQRSIVDNKHLFKDKIVLDIGCGTGILSLFAAKVGAKHVYGIDCADIADTAKLIVKENGYQNKITIIKGKVEDIKLPVDKVDIIVSEWMGYFLLYESMMDTVIYARDKWLKKDGILMPDKARLHVCAIEDGKYRKEKVDFWDNVYGFKMSCIKATALSEPLVDVVPPEQVISNHCTVLNLDLYKMKKADLDFSSEYKVKFTRQDYCHALVFYFDVQFSKCHTEIGFGTAPWDQYTHWKQTVFYLNDPILAVPGREITGNVKYENPKDVRDLIMDLT